MSTYYAYSVSDDILDGIANSIEGALDNFVSEINTYDIDVLKDEKGLFIYSDVCEVVEYEEIIDGDAFIRYIIDCNYYDIGENDWYLHDIDKKALTKELTGFWRKFKKKYNVATMMEEKNNTRMTFKVYIKETEYGYNLISYEEVM